MTPSLPALPEGAALLPAGSPGYTFRHSVREVRLQFTVADEQGRLVQDLSPEDIRIFDNQLPVLSFNHFERDQNLPLHLGLVLDTSDSVKRVLPEEKAAAVRFLLRVMRPLTDDAFIMGFGGNFKVWQSPTDNRQELIDAVTHLRQPGWGTRLFDALYSACANQIPMGDGRLVRRAIIVLSDGDDTDSFRSLADVIAVAQRNEMQIYALTMHSKRPPRSAPFGYAQGRLQRRGLGAPESFPLDRGASILRRLAEATGGRQYVVQSSKDLDAAFTQIEQELRTQYYVSFPPVQLTPGFHALRIEVSVPQKLEVHARQGYYAMAQ